MDDEEGRKGRACREDLHLCCGAGHDQSCKLAIKAVGLRGWQEKGRRELNFVLWHACVCVCVCMCVYVCVCVCVCVHVCMFVLVCVWNVYTWMNYALCLYICIHVDVYTHVCVTHTVQYT